MDDEYGHAANNREQNRVIGNLNGSLEAGVPAGSTPPPNAMQQDRQEYVEREAGARTAGSRPGVIGRLTRLFNAVRTPLVDSRLPSQGLQQENAGAAGGREAGARTAGSRSGVAGPVRNLIFGAVRTSIEAFRRASQGLQQENAGAAGAREEVERAGDYGDSQRAQEQGKNDYMLQWLEVASTVREEGAVDDKNEVSPPQVLSNGGATNRFESSRTPSSIASSSDSKTRGLSRNALFGFDSLESPGAIVGGQVTTTAPTTAPAPTPVPAVGGLADHALGANLSGSSRGNSPGQ